MSRFESQFSDRVASLNKSWEGEAVVTVNGHEYQCNMDVEVQLCMNGNPNKAILWIDQFEAEIGGKPVIDRNTRRDIRMELSVWVEEHRDEIIRKAR